MYISNINPLKFGAIKIQPAKNRTEAQKQFITHLADTPLFEQSSCLPITEDMFVEEKDNGDTRISVKFNTPKGKYIIGSDRSFFLNRGFDNRIQSMLKPFTEEIENYRQMLKDCTNEDIERLENGKLIIMPEWMSGLF